MKEHKKRETGERMTTPKSLQTGTIREEMLAKEEDPPEMKSAQPFGLPACPRWNVNGTGSQASVDDPSGRFCARSGNGREVRLNSESNQ